MNLKPLLIFPPLAVGILGYIWMTQPDETAREAIAPEPLAVRIMTAAPEALIVTATGYGRVEAVRNWAALSQVDGRVIEVFPNLAEGAIVDEGDLIAQIDKTDFEIAIQKSNANIAAAEASLTEIAGQEINSMRLLELENRVLDVVKAEFERAEKLVKGGTSTQASLDTAQKSLLAQENSITGLQNTLELYPAQIASAQATLAVRKAELEEAARSLEETTVIAPFRGRVASTSVEKDQFIRTGEELIKLEAVDSVEVVASFQPGALRPLIFAFTGTQDGAQVTLDVTQALAFFQNAGIEAKVRLDSGGRVAEYDARLARFQGAVDGKTGALGVAVQIDDPLISTDLMTRPPLSVGTFVSVDLQTPSIDGLLTVPRSVVGIGDDGAPFLYLADAKDTLRIQPVSLGPVVGDRVVVQDGLISGERVVLSSPRPPIEGLVLKPISVDKDN